MIKLCTIFILCFLAFCFIPVCHCHAQTDSLAAYQDDSTSEADLDYHLTKAQFVYYYGDDDTARALINMFFRKRNFFAVERSTNGLGTTGNYCGPVALIVFTDGIAATIYGIRAAINCSIYTRQALLYALVDRENGYPIPPQFERKLRKRDFY